MTWAEVERLADSTDGDDWLAAIGAAWEHAVVRNLPPEAQPALAKLWPLMEWLRVIPDRDWDDLMNARAGRR